MQDIITKFEVVDILFEPHSLSKWTLYHKQGGQFEVEQGDKTYSQDLNFIGHEVKGWLSVAVDEAKVSASRERKASFACSYVTATGLYEGEVRTKLNGELYISYKLSSTVPMKISEIPKGAKPGDWIEISGYVNLWLSRDI